MQEDEGDNLAGDGDASSEYMDADQAQDTSSGHQADRPIAEDFAKAKLSVEPQVMRTPSVLFTIAKLLCVKPCMLTLAARLH